jgi:hypothetical protein
VTPVSGSVFHEVLNTAAAKAIGIHTLVGIPSTKLGLPPSQATVLMVVADSSHQIDETDENNNFATWVSDLAGEAWFNSYAGQWPQSVNPHDLAEPFRTNVLKFIAALEEAGATPEIVTVIRPAERAYLMHWSWMIVYGDTRPNGDHKPVKPADVPAYPGVNIRWDYGDDALSIEAAKQLIRKFDTAYYASEKSYHINGLAIDMNVTWTGTLKIKNASGTVVSIPTGTGPTNSNNANNTLLARVAASYGVIRNQSEDTSSHWSLKGN